MLISLCFTIKFSGIFSAIQILLALFIGAVYFQSSQSIEIKYPFKIQNLKNVLVFGKVEETELTRYDRFNIIVKLDSLEVRQRIFKSSDQIRLTIKDKSKTRLFDFYKSLNSGDLISAKCNLKKARNKRNPGEFDYYLYLTENQISALGYIKNVEDIKITKNDNLFSNLILLARKYIDEILRGLNDKQTYSLLRGLILADRNLIDYEDKQNFVNSGVIHVLAVSGLHVGFIAIIFYALFSRFHLFPRSLLTILGLLIFMFIPGSPPSVVRATIMAVTLIFSLISGRSQNIFNNLAISGLIILIINPEDIFNPGFQLSFSAVLSIVIFAPFFEKHIRKLKVPKFLKNIILLFSVSFAAQLGTLPFTLYYFGKLSLISLVANLFVIPLIGIILGIAMTGILFSFISLNLAQFYSITNNYLTELLFYLTEISGNFSFSFIKISNFTLFDSFCYYLFLILLSVFVFETFIPQIVNLPVIQIIAMIKRICVLPTWADRFYCRPSVSGMCKKISTSALIGRSKNIMV